MKKILALMTGLTLSFSLVACGGVNKDAVTEAFNSTNTELNTVGTLANDNLDKMDQATMDALTDLANAMEAYKVEIERDDLSQDRADEIVSELSNYPAIIAEMKTVVDTLIDNADAGITEEQAVTLTQILQSLADVHAKFAEYYDSFNDETKEFVNEIAQMVNDIGSVLDGSLAIDSTRADMFIQGSQEVLEAAETGWAEIEVQLAD